jgi:hypothetical protein
MASRWKRDLPEEVRNPLSPRYAEAEARRLAVSEWAQSLIGLEPDEAEQRVAAEGYLERGYHVVVVPRDSPTTLDADPGRIRLLLDEYGRVKWAAAG